MHILWLIPNYYSFLVEELTALSSAVQRVSVISQSDANTIHHIDVNILQRTKHNPVALARRLVNIIRFFSTIPLPVSAKSIRNANNISKVNEFVSDYVKRENVDIIHSHFCYPFGTSGITANVNCPCVSTLRGIDIFEDKSINYGLMLDSNYKQIAKYCLKRVSAITVASSITEDALKSKFESCSEVITIPNGVDRDIFNRDATKQNVVERIRSAGKRVILGVGSLDKRKGYEYLIEAFHNLANRYEDVALVIVGDGPEREALQKRINELNLQNIIHLPGKLSRTEVAGCFASCSVFVHPSLLEGFGNVILEAMASSCPIVATKESGAVADFVEHGVNGYVISARDSIALEAAMGNILDNRLNAEKMGRAARITISERNLTLENRIERFCELYEKLTSSQITGAF